MQLKQQILNNKIIIQNFSYLSLFQVFTLVIPLITYPYLIKVVGLELYGVVIFAQTIVSYISLVINFGFNISGPRDVAIYKNDHDLLSKYVSSIYIIKLGIWLICFLLYMILINSLQFFKEYRIVYFFAYFITFNDLLFPIWFFQGIEKMKYITYINLFVRSLFVIAIFVFIKKSVDFIYIPLLNGIGALVSGSIALYIVFKKEGVVFTRVSKQMLWSQLKDGFSLFISTISIQLYLNVNKLIIGRFLGMSEVTIYDLAQKIILVLKIPIGMFSQAIFPKISRERSIKFINKMMFFAVSVIIIMYLFLYFSSNWIVLTLMHRKMPLAVSVIRILGFSIIFVALNTFLGSNRLIPFGLNKKFMTATIYNSIVYFLLIGFLFAFHLINIYTISYTYVSVEVFAFILLLYINKRLNLLWSRSNENIKFK